MCEVLDISDCGILLSVAVGCDKVFMLVCLYFLQLLILDGLEKYLRICFVTHKSEGYSY